MGKNIISKSDPSQISEHPAYIAWKKLGFNLVKPNWIERLENRHEHSMKRRKHSIKRRIYRLHGAGPESSHVVAKLCEKETGLREQTINEQILSNLPLTTPRFYGLVEYKPKLCWVFLEYIRGERYSAKNADHRRLAASWLGLMHTSTQRFIETVYLPDRGPEYYKDQIEIARTTIMRNFDNVALSEKDKMILHRIISHLDEIASSWNKMEDFCKGMPRTLVHGDLVAKNVLVRSTNNEYTIVPFDWGTTSGWGPPAVDLIQFVGRSVSPDLDIYRKKVCKEWPYLKSSDIKHLAEIGKIFRLIISIKWESESLAYEWIEHPISAMRIYESELSDSIQAKELEY